MAREIKFRAKDFTKSWNYGCVAVGNETAVLFPKMKDGSVRIGVQFYVVPDTICQFTGLRDELDHEVYEGDIIMLDGSPELGYRVVVYYEEAFCIATRKEYDLLCKGEHPYMNDYAHMTCLNEWSNTGLVRVVGNVYDNPELLTKSENEL